MGLNVVLLQSKLLIMSHLFSDDLNYIDLISISRMILTQNGGPTLTNFMVTDN